MGQLLKAVRITLVEDNPADVLLVKKALQGRGIAFELTCFEDGQTALKGLSQRQPPHLILLDLNLPGTEGMVLLGKIRNMPRLADVPVAILTSSDSPGDLQRARTLGAARYIRKPSMLDDFLRDVGGGVEEMLRSAPG